MVADHLIGSDSPHKSVVLLIIAQDTAALLAREGWTKTKIREFIDQNARIPFSSYKERFLDTGKSKEARERPLYPKSPGQ